MGTTMNQNALDGAKGEIVLYQPDETIRLEVRMEDETVWLTQQQMAELFLITKQNVSLHVSNIYKEDELKECSTVKDYLTTATDGKTNTMHSTLLSRWNCSTKHYFVHGVQMGIVCLFVFWLNKSYRHHFPSTALNHGDNCIF